MNRSVRRRRSKRQDGSAYLATSLGAFGCTAALVIQRGSTGGWSLALWLTSAAGLICAILLSFRAETTTNNGSSALTMLLAWVAGALGLLPWWVESIAWPVVLPICAGALSVILAIRAVVRGRKAGSKGAAA
jgi:hypothetical protein